MSIFSNFHTHTYFCDGKDSPEDMVKEAIRLGCPKIGFSGHSYTPFDESYCMMGEREEKYIEEVLCLKEQYKDVIEIHLGVEQDYYSEHSDAYEYCVGSVHYVKKGNEYIPIDESPEILKSAVSRLYNGDFYSLCEDYYSLVADVFKKTNCKIVGHFDLITKFNEKEQLFDENNPRYIKAAVSALDNLLKDGALLEVNTGAMSRGWRTSPYPSKFILNEIRKRGAKVILSSDSHCKEHLLFDLEEAKILCESYNLEIVDSI